MRLSILALAAVLVYASTACDDRPFPAEPVVAAPPATIAARQAPPEDVDQTFTFEGGCSFAILVHVVGKTKFIELPDGSTIMTNPGVVVTLTNLDNQHQETFGITGAFHQDTLPNGDLVTVSTGRSLTFDPVAGLVLIMGRFSWIFDAQGNLVQPLQGNGRVVDVCELLS